MIRTPIHVIAKKGPLEGLKAPTFELGKIQKNNVGIVLFRLEGIGLKW